MPGFVPTVSQLAQMELLARGIDREADLIATELNIETAEQLGTITRYYAGEVFVGFVAWVRLSLEALFEAALHQQRCFLPEDHTDMAPAVFVVEQLNCQGFREELRRLRELAALPRAQLLAGWRNNRFSVWQITDGCVLRRGH